MDNHNVYKENWNTTEGSEPYDSNLQTFYRDQKVFITGGTGFLGKLLVEKLLRCTEISSVYMLIREKKGKSPEERIEEYFNDIVFDRLKCLKPKYKYKIIPVQGDCMMAGLGLSLTDRKTLIRNVNVVFHVAATVNFNEKLQLAYSINVKGTESVMNLCKQAENLKSFVYVSTAYSNCHLSSTIEEKFYDIVNYKDVEVLVEKMNDEDVESSTKRILGKWPNTYTFTKALAESVLREQGNRISIGIFRPAIVTSTFKEPIAGWIDNLYGPTGACTGASSGLLRVMLCHQDNKANIVPADMCVSALIASAWDTFITNNKKLASDIPIYNYVASQENSITWREYYTINKMYANVYPYSNALWCVKFIIASNQYSYNIKKVMYHYFPAVLMDFFGLLLAKKPRFYRLYSKIHRFSDVIAYFAMSDWKFSDRNARDLWTKLTPEDRKAFFFDASSLNWMLYFKAYMLGIRLYLLKDPLETIPKAKTKQNRFHVLHSVLKTLFLYFSVRFVVNRGLGSLRKRLLT